MARIQYVMEDVASDDAAAALADVVRTRGYVSNFHRTLAHVPEVLRAFEQFSASVRATPLPTVLRELAILRVSALLHNEYEWHRHSAAATKAGLGPELIAELGSWQTSPAFDESQRAVLAFVDAYVLDDDVDEKTVDALRTTFGDAATVGLCVTVGWYLLVSAVIKPLRLIDDDTAEPSPFDMPAPAPPRSREGDRGEDAL